MSYQTASPQKAKLGQGQKRPSRKEAHQALPPCLQLSSVKRTWTISLSESPKAAFKARSMPIFIVAPEDAHVPQAPYVATQT